MCENEKGEPSASRRSHGRIRSVESSFTDRFPKPPRLWNPKIVGRLWYPKVVIYFPKLVFTRGGAFAIIKMLVVRGLVVLSLPEQDVEVW